MSPDRELAVVVMSYRNEATVADAVASVLGQDPAAEVVVSHSGGGLTPRLVAERFPGVRIVSSDRRRLPGAARNAGVEATTAPYVAFLEADNVAAPGWIDGRLARHRAGAAAVACAKGPLVETPAAWAACLLRDWYRLPAHLPVPRSRHGVSFGREVLERVGPFPEHVRVGEDTIVTHRLVAAGIEIAWAPEVVTLERYPAHPVGLIADAVRRGARRTRSVSYLDGAAIVASSRRAHRRAVGLARSRERATVPATTPALMAIAAQASLAGRRLGRVLPAQEDTTGERLARRVVVVADRGPARRLLGGVHRLAARGVGVAVTAGLPASAYVRGSQRDGEAVHGLSDIDLTVLADGLPAARRAADRWARIRASLPLAGWIECGPIADADTARAAARSPGPLAGPEIGLSEVAIAIGQRPELTGPLGGWDRIAGPERRNAPRDWRGPERCVAAWAELGFWWRHAFALTAHPDVPWAALSCVKLVAEPARVLAWLLTGRRPADRAAALRAVATVVDPAPLETAARTWGRIRGNPAAPLDEALAGLTAITHAVAEEIERLADTDAVESVALVRRSGPSGATASGPAPDRRAAAASMPPSERAELERLGVHRLLPLVDQRALLGPHRPDPAVALVPGAPLDPIRVGRLGSARLTQTLPALVDGQLAVLCAAPAARSAQRGIATPATDPLTWASVAEADSAGLAAAAGWSARRVAARALEVHSERLRREAAPGGRGVGGSLEDGERLARLLAGARAILFAASVDAGAPSLAVDLGATVDQARSLGLAATEVLAEAERALRAGRECAVPASRDLADRVAAEVARMYPRLRAVAPTLS